MPGFNQKGPMGQGPMTGRRMGRCTNFGANQKNAMTTPEETRDGESLPGNNLANGQGLGRGRGGVGRGMGLGRGQGGLGRGMGRQNRFRGGV